MKDFKRCKLDSSKNKELPVTKETSCWIAVEFSLPDQQYKDLVICNAIYKASSQYLFFIIVSSWKTCIRIASSGSVESVNLVVMAPNTTN